MNMPMRHLRTYIQTALLGLSLCLATTQVQAAQTLVRVIAYPFPPFLYEDNKTGLTPDIIALLNDVQKEFKFTLKITSPNRRYYQFQSAQADLILFEMPEWGWTKSGLGFEATPILLQGGEKYITQRKPGRTQAFFDNIQSKSISAYIGYHYGFADYNADPNWLERRFRIMLHNSHSRIIDLVLKDKVDIGVVTQSFLRKYLYQKPQLRDQLLISEGFDQIYKLRTLIRKNAPITATRFHELIKGLKNSGQLRALLVANGLEDHLIE